MRAVDIHPAPRKPALLLELQAAELAALLCALRLDALAARASADWRADELGARRLEHRAQDAERLRHAVARASGPITATAALRLQWEDVYALAEVLERLAHKLAARHSWGLVYAGQHPVDPARLADRLTAATARS